MKQAAALFAILLLAACGTGPRTRAPRSAQAPQGPAARSSEPRPAPARPDPVAPAVRGKSFPECDPRSQDADRVHVGMGLLVGDCQDDGGNNAVYATRFAPLKGAPSPAQRAGLRAGDRLIRIDACEVRSSHDVATQLSRALPGWVARVYVERGGRSLDIFVPTVTLGRGRDLPPAATLSTAGCKAIGRRPAG
ncbi:MAG TPA: PDZ domain-containing protein [Usitatibacter sp.]|nr:PDZ domain-containing protein [Usitatibacter sp.]